MSPADLSLENTYVLIKQGKIEFTLTYVGRRKLRNQKNPCTLKKNTQLNYTFLLVQISSNQSRRVVMRQFEN